jgi:hypothetical protein
MARMRRGWRCSYRARITLSLLPVDARRIRTLACRSMVVEVDWHRQRGDMVSPVLCCRPRKGGRRRLSSSGAWAPPVSHIPKRYVAWAGCWATLLGFGLVSSPLYFFCLAFLFYFSCFTDLYFNLNSYLFCRIWNLEFLSKVSPSILYRII